MFFASDNAGPAHPKVIEAVAAANAGYAPSYGADPLTRRAVEKVREVFEAPEAEVRLVATGTGCNAMLLAALAQPWETIFLGHLAHAQTDESNAVEFMTGGSKAVPVGRVADRFTAAELEAAAGQFGFGDIHSPGLGAVTVTQVTERGTVYRLDELAAIGAVAADRGMAFHMDGARFANALVALGTTAAEMTWRRGVDAVSFGGTKNGCLAVEAAVVFDPARAATLERRRMRAGHLFSKHRLLAAQIDAYLTDGLWLELAARANAAGARMAAGLARIGHAELLFPVEANMIFVTLPRAVHRRLRAAGAVYALYDGPLDSGDPEAPLMARLVCDWSCEDAAIDRFLDIAAG